MKNVRAKVWKIVKFLPEMNSITTEAELRSAANYIADDCAKLIRREVRTQNKELRAAIKPFANWAIRPSQKPTLEDCNRALLALNNN